MANFATACQLSPVGTGFKTICELLGGTGGRFKLYDVLIGASGTPADNALVHDLIRITATGTDTTIVPVPLDPADAAALVVGGEDATVEATTTGIPLIIIPLNLRASYRWVAAPNSEIIVAAVSGEGLIWRAKSAAYTGQSEATLFHSE